MKTIIIGATGTIGKAITSLIREKGNDVIEASRSVENHIDIEIPKSIDEFFSKQDSVDAIICVAGDASFGSLNSLTDEQIDLGLKSKLLGQINVVRKGISKLNPNGVIVITGGMLAYSPWPETSNIATANAGLEGFTKAVALELTEGRRIVIVHPPFISETAEAMGMATTPWPNSSEVANIYLKSVEGKENGEAIFVDGYLPK
jgi:NAD(P)-dependent dehydrogenase (short-subunit alcohol dehydrogenase family)